MKNMDGSRRYLKNNADSLVIGLGVPVVTSRLVIGLFGTA